MEKTTPNAVLNTLVDAYEKSKASFGISDRTLNIKLKMDRYDKKYYDSSEFERYKAYQESIRILERLDFITAHTEGNFVMSITLNQDKIADIYTWLHRDSIQDIRAEIMSDLNQESMHDEVKAIRTFLKKREQAFQSNKQYFKDVQELRDLMVALEWLHNSRDRELSLRQASQIIYGNTKKLERLVSKLCKLLKETQPSLETVPDTEILETFGLVRNPTYIYLKGSLDIHINDQVLSLAHLEGSIGLSSELLPHLSVSGEAPHTLITIENLDAFHKASIQNGALIYLGGYHNSAKRQFLQRIYEVFPTTQYYHFGDLDAGGFSIYQDLVHKTSIPFQPMLMDTETLMHYKSYAQPLTQNDRRKLELMKESIFGDVIEVMLNENIKLEQEIIDTSVFMHNFDH